MKKILCFLFTITVFLNSALVSGDFLYRAQDVGTLSKDASEARSLNQKGSVVGKYWMGEYCHDFLWVPKMGLLTINENSDPRSYPALNNYNEVLGVIFESSGFNFLKSYSVQQYFYSFQTGKKTRGNKMLLGIGEPPMLYEIKRFNDNRDRLYHFSLRLSATLKSTLIQSDYAPYLVELWHILRMNEYMEMLVVSPAKALLKILDKDQELIAEVSDNPLSGIALNDMRDVIATNPNATEGFFWSFKDHMKGETALISLGSFIPTALNNHGEIVGKLLSASNEENRSFWLRKRDGTMIELNEAIDFNGMAVEKILETWAINDRGQILISASLDGKRTAFLLNPIQD